MEGIEVKILDEEFGLREKGLSSLVVVPIGYRDAAADFNAALPKSRLTYADSDATKPTARIANG
ncbi:hypothetical protein PSQ90_13400 [Devosia rhodophyticola]|uniref:Uncharacterized protein n=1 Tax=Devosia rhodophyticola TaxID=3026423 RepID=A0ABY7YVE2_9HYPH|nr:hypothetical protein [Devosia rhodophyticola]WDR05276.1 hypothetical protein PSQ90_13400 [Devosia rhodophyticola]